jgi:CUB domain
MHIYRSVLYGTACGGTINADEVGDISSPGWPHNYPSLSNCTWVIRATNPGYMFYVYVRRGMLSDDSSASVVILNAVLHFELLGSIRV